MQQIGRKLYYELDAGKVILDTGERMGDVRKTTVEEDFTAYPSLQGCDPATIGVMSLAYGERADGFTNAGGTWIENGQVVIYPRMAINVDKPTIISDGIDTATITITIADPLIVQTVAFTVGVGTPITLNTSNGVVKFQIATNLPGEFIVTISSEKNGSDSVTIVGV